MPYKSAKQRKFFEGCRHNPSKMGGHCPPKKVLDEFHNATYHSETKQARHAQKKRGAVRYL